MNFERIIYLKKYILKLIAFSSLLLILFLTSSIHAQDTTESLAFKNNKPQTERRLFYRPDLAYQIWQHLKLLQKANEGDVLAEHELGLRYLFGEGFAADTVKAAYWIKKAADKGLAAACYNFGILLNNGWGVKWNPFKAFNYFMTAAKDGMPQAENVIGIIYTDNLIVKRNWSKAYNWIKKSADGNYKPAKDLLSQFKKRINVASLDTASAENNINGKKDSSANAALNSSLNSTLGLVYIDFHARLDTSTKIDNKLLLDDLLHPGNDSLSNAIGLSYKNDSSFKFDSTSLLLLNKFAENGSPEALTLLGRFYEKGIHYKQDLLNAADFYVRAIRLDSPRSPKLLWDMIRKNNFFKTLQHLAEQKNPEAMFVWYSLHILGFENTIVDSDAFKLLEQSAEANFAPAVNELGLDYFTGKIVKQDTAKARKLWKKAESLGAAESKVRLATADIFGNTNDQGLRSAIETLKSEIKKGSVLAQATLAYCYESGTGIAKSIPEAVRYYRYAAERGSQYAYKELKRLYDSIRPSGNEFSIN